MSRHPVEVNRSVGPDLEQISTESGDRQVRPDAACVVEHERVGDGADRLVDVVGGQSLQVVRGSGTGDFVAGQRCHVVHRDMTASPRCFCDRDRRPVARGPVVALRDLHATGDEFVEYRLIGLEPRWTLPQIRDPELCAQSGLPVVERAGAYASWSGNLIVWVDDVVHLDERLRTRREDVVVCESGVFEPVEIELVGVDSGCAVDHPLGDGAGDTCGVRDPHRLGDPESLEVAMFSDDGVPVGGEREDSVESVVDLSGCEFRYEHGGLVPGLGEIVWREHQFRRHLLERDRRVVVERVDVARHGAMAVVADTEAVTVLAVVEVVVLMAQDWQ